MRRLVLLTLFVLAPITTAAHADGCPPASCGTTSIAPASSGVLLVRPHGQFGPVVGYDLVTGRRHYALPSGVLSSDGSTFASARSRQGRATTTVVRYSVRTGGVSSRWTIGGRMTVAAVSPDGRQVALVRNLVKRTIITRTIVTVVGRRGRSTISLRGVYEVEALSRGGGRVFLIHWNSSGGYALENVDLGTRRLSPTLLDEPDEKMSGIAQTAVASRDGRRLLTLYLKPGRHTFVHALDLKTGLAHCIDLPLAGVQSLVGGSALALSPDGRHLYVTSPFLGRLLSVDLRTFRIRHDVHFRRPAFRELDVSEGTSAAVTPNGRMLAFGVGRKAWLYDTAYGRAPRALTTGARILGLGFTPTGRKLVVVTARGPRTFDAATGAPTS